MSPKVSLPAGHAAVFVGCGNCFRKVDSSGTPKDRVSNALQQSAHTETLPFIYNGYVTFPDLKITKHFNRRDFDLLVKWNACYLISSLFTQHIRSSLWSNSGDCSAEEGWFVVKPWQKVQLLSGSSLPGWIRTICSLFDTFNLVLFVHWGQASVSLHSLGSQQKWRSVSTG